MEKSQLDFQMQNIMLNLLKKKNALKKFNSPRSSPDPENVWCGHQQPFNFFSVFCRFPDTFRRLRKTFLGGLEAEKLAVTGEKFFAIISRGNVFRGDRKKSLFHYI